MANTPTVLSDAQKAIYNAIGQAYGKSKIDSDKAVDDFKNAVVTEVPKVIDGITTMVKVVDYYQFEQASLAWKSGYAQVRAITMYLTDSKLNPTLNQAFSEFMNKVGDRHGIAKPTKPTEQAQDKADQREKAKTAKEVLMAQSVESLTQQAQALSITGDKGKMKEAVKLLDVIEAKAKAEEKAIADAFKNKQKRIKELVVNCNNHADLDSIIEVLKNYKPAVVSIGAII